MPGGWPGTLQEAHPRPTGRSTPVPLSLEMAGSDPRGQTPVGQAWFPPGHIAIRLPGYHMQTPGRNGLGTGEIISILAPGCSSFFTLFPMAVTELLTPLTWLRREPSSRLRLSMAGPALPRSSSVRRLLIAAICRDSFLMARSNLPGSAGCLGSRFTFDSNLPRLRWRLDMVLRRFSIPWKTSATPKVFLTILNNSE
jgi:hypothetical protein